MSFDESIVVELKFGRFNHSTAEFQTFLSNFKQLYRSIKSENPLAMFFTGDFNAHSQMWWSEGNTTPEGVVIEDLFTSLGLHQLICETNKNPSCIGLVVIDQPNLVLDSGTRPSLDSFCHHQIIHCKVNFRIHTPPAYERKVWHFNRANVNAIKKSMTNFPWLQHLSLNRDPNWQVKTFTNTILNIMANFVPHETKNIIPRDSPWITKQLKTMLNRKNRLFRNYKRHGYKEDDRLRLDAFRFSVK